MSDPGAFPRGERPLNRNAVDVLTLTQVTAEGKDHGLAGGTRAVPPFGLLPSPFDRRHAGTSKFVLYRHTIVCYKHTI